MWENEIEYYQLRLKDPDNTRKWDSLRETETEELWTFYLDSFKLPKEKEYFISKSLENLENFYIRLLAQNYLL